MLTFYVWSVFHSVISVFDFAHDLFIPFLKTLLILTALAGLTLAMWLIGRNFEHMYN